MFILCKRCGNVFPSPIKIVGPPGGTSTGMLNNNTVNCNICGCLNKIPSGTFEFDDKGNSKLISNIESLNFSKKELSDLAIISQDIYVNGLNEKVFIERIKEIGLEPKAILALNNSKISFLIFLGTLILALNLILNKAEENTSKLGSAISVSKESISDHKKKPVKQPIINKGNRKKEYNKTDTLLHEARRARQKAIRKKNK